MDLAKPVKAIVINSKTFPKIEEHLKPEEMEALRQYYYTMENKMTVCFITKVVFENGDSYPACAMPWTYLAQRYVYETNPDIWISNEWFEVTPNAERWVLL